MAKETPVVEHPRWTIETWNLNNNIPLFVSKKAGAKSKIFIQKTWMDFYAKRKQLSAGSLFEFIKEMKMLKSRGDEGMRVMPRHKHHNKFVVVNWCPHLNSNPKKETFLKFCCFDLAKYKPWKGHISDA